MAVEGAIVRIIVPTQLPVGSVNCYLLRGAESVLVDTGPHDPEAFARLDRGLQRAGTTLEELDVILITHGHVDHYGQAGRLARATGAEIWAPEADRHIIENFARVYEDRRGYYRERLLRTGISKERLQQVGHFFDYVKRLAEPAPVSRGVRDGDSLSFGDWELQALHTPGHSAGSTCFRMGGSLLAGDTVLKHITPNAAFGGADGRSVGMGDYLASLARLEALDVGRVYPGHGPPVDDLQGFIDNYRTLYAERRATLLHALGEEPHSAMALVERLFGRLPPEEIFLGVTEVLGHVEILEREEEIEAEERDGVLYYRRSD